LGDRTVDHPSRTGSGASAFEVQEIAVAKIAEVYGSSSINIFFITLDSGFNTSTHGI
jgi:hypothetical protein